MYKLSVFVIPAIPNAFGRSGILLKNCRKDSGQAGMTDYMREDCVYTQSLIEFNKFDIPMIL